MDKNGDILQTTELATSACCMNDCKFDAVERPPKLLLCLHRACGECLVKYQKEEEGKEGGYACHEPNCCRSIGRPPEQLPLDELLVRELTEAADASCDGCDGVATHHCGKCAVLMCSTCVEAHKTNPLRFIREHPLITLEAFRKECAAGDTANPPRCAVHKDEPIKMFCNTCNIAICLLCGTVSHKGDDHEIVTLEHAHGPQKEKIAALAGAMESTETEATDAATKVSGVREELEANIKTAKAVVEADFRLISQAAVRTRKALLAKIDDAGQGRVKVLADQTMQLENRARSAHLAQQFSLKLVTKGNQFETLQSANVVVSGMTDLVDKKPPHDPLDIADFEFRGSTGGAAALVKAIEDYGTVLEHGRGAVDYVTTYSGPHPHFSLTIPKDWKGSSALAAGFTPSSNLLHRLCVVSGGKLTVTMHFESNGDTDQRFGIMTAASSQDETSYSAFDNHNSSWRVRRDEAGFSLSGDLTTMVVDLNEHTLQFWRGGTASGSPQKTEGSLPEGPFLVAVGLYKNRCRLESMTWTP